MCGIFGLFSFGPGHPDPGWADLAQLLLHRGPDDGGQWRRGPFLLAHRRLAIIDAESGQQPMCTPDGGLAVTFNGEIYNHRELRAQLEARGHTFRTMSDTEVLLHGFREWGRDLPGRLVGPFAFAIADADRGELFLARDRFGEKPLLLLRTPELLAFASELAPLTALPGFPRQLDERALGEYLVLNYVPGERTLAAGVERLPPATWRVHDASGRMTSGRYWTPPACERAGPTDERPALEELRARLDTAVRRALTSDVPVAVLLSGGLDSSLIAESAARQGGVSHAYVLEVPGGGFSERAAAEEVARRLSLRLEVVPLAPPTGDDLLAVAAHADDPLGDSSALAVGALSRAVARGHRVALGGDGGDEVFAGYLTYRATALHARFVRRLPLPVRRALARASALLPIAERKVATSYKAARFLRASALPSSAAHFTWNGSWLPEEAAGLLRPATARAAARRALEALCARHGLGDACALLDLQRADVSEYLPNDILAKVDRMSMAHSLEVRAPFLDVDLATWGLGLPAPLKLGPGGASKRLLRAAARQVFGPAIADRPKQGFSVPIHAWIRGPLREVVGDLLAPASVARCGALDPVAVSRVLDAHMGGAALGFEVWGLALLVAWHRLRLEGAPAAPPERHTLLDVSASRVGAPTVEGLGDDGAELPGRAGS